MADGARRVVVVGAGMAGLTAALSAQEAGATVVLLETGAAAGGSAAMSAGFITTFRSYEDYQRVIPRGDQAQGRAVMEQYEDAVRWLADQGVLLEEGGAEGDGEFGFGRRRHMDPPRAMAHLASRFQARGGTLRTRSRAVQLVTDEHGAIAGVVAQTEGRRGTEPADAVVLAGGGFQGNADLTTRYVGRWADRMPVRSNPGSVGDGLLLGRAIGAASSRGLHSFYGHLLPAPPAVITPERFFPTTAYYSRYTVLVNLAGERFTDESLGDHLNAQAAVRQDRAEVFAIFDGAAYEQHLVQNPVNLNRFKAGREAGAWIATESTLEGVVERLGERGVRRGTLLQTLRAYNRAMAEGTDEPLPVPRAQDRLPLQRPDYYAIALVPAITFTFGGLRIDERCRVLDRAGTAIAGLYAAGADAGGTYYEQYGGGLAMSLTLGRIAGAMAGRAS